MLASLLLTVIFLGYANGANDNFKGVATLFGSGASNYRRALGWACWATLAGSLAAIWLARGLAQSFSGKGLVPDGIVGSPGFLVSIGLGAAATVWLSTRLGLPISTTHALTGALMGAGLVHSGGLFAFSRLGSVFFAPLLLSPLLAVAVAGALYVVFRAFRLALAVDKESCVCLGEQVLHSISHPAAGESVLRPVPLWQITVGSREQCRQIYVGSLLGVPVGRALDLLHYASAGAVSFARGLNDTPKIAALLFATELVSPAPRYGLVALCMALGGWISARRVAETMSHKITALNMGQGFSANLATAILVIGASTWGLPVSTTHVSAGSLFGIGWLSRSANTRVISSIVLSWVATLPLAAFLSALLSWGLRAYV